MLSHPGDITIFSCFSTTISGLKVRKSISLKCKRQLEGELEWGTLCLNYGFWQCLASPLWTVAWNCTPSVKWGAPVSVHSQLLFSVSLVCYRASSKVYLCIVCTHASCHRMRLYIYLYLCILYIYICNICRSLHVWKWTRENKTEATSHCPRQNTQKRAQQPHRECTRAHTYAQSQVFNTQVYTEVESDSQSLRGKWKGCVLKRALARHRIRLTVNGHLPAPRAHSRPCATQRCIECTAECVKERTMSAENTRVQRSHASDWASYESCPKRSWWAYWRRKEDDTRSRISAPEESVGPRSPFFCL